MLFTLSYSNLPASRTTVAAWENRVLEDVLAEGDKVLARRGYSGLVECEGGSKPWRKSRTIGFMVAKL